MLAPGGAVSERRDGLALLLGFVLVSFAANSLVTRHVVAAHLLDPGLLTVVRVLAGALALAAVAAVRRERVRPGRRHLAPTLALGVYAVCISYGYRLIGAAAGTFVFYALVMLTLVGWDLARHVRLASRRYVGAAVSLVGLAVLSAGRTELVTVPGVLLLALTGTAWGAYTALGRTAGDPRTATTANFVLLAAVLLLPGVAGVAVGLPMTAAGIAWGAALGAGTTAFAYVAWYACQRSLSATQAGTVQLVIPVLTAVGAVLLLGEQISLQLAVAAVLVALGMWLAQGAPRTSR
jgi:drug/metabolite transporter (DMT)-like permease